MKILIGLTALIPATSAWAHHPLAGMPMETLWHGLLSGVGHPLLGSDHLAFILLVGLISFASTGLRRAFAPGLFVTGSTAGLIAGYAGVGGFFVEPGVMLSILLLGMCIAAGWTNRMSHTGLSSLIAISGVVHGIAFSGALIGVEATNTSVLVGYLIGLACTLGTLSLASGYMFAGFTGEAYKLDDLKPRLIGAAIAGVGAFIIFEEVEGIALTLAGLA